MTAKVLGCSNDNGDVIVNVGYYETPEGGSPVEQGVQTFRFGPTITTQQARADIVAYGKQLTDRVRETSRLMSNLQPGTEFTI